MILFFSLQIKAKKEDAMLTVITLALLKTLASFLI